MAVHGNDISISAAHVSSLSSRRSSMFSYILVALAITSTFSALAFASKLGHLIQSHHAHVPVLQV